MTDGLRLQSTMSKALSQFLPTLRATRRRNLAWLAVGTHLAQHVHLSKIAACRPGAATLSSKTMRLSRLLLGLAWAYVWLMHVGAWAIKRGLRPLVDRTDRRD